MFAWYKPDGGLKEMSCRVAMLRMHRDGLIQLPPPRCKKPVCKIIPSSRTDPQFPITAPVHELSCIQLKSVRLGDESRLWNEYIQRYHYLGFTLVPGAQMRYFVLGRGLSVGLTNREKEISILSSTMPVFLFFPGSNRKGWHRKHWLWQPEKYPTIGTLLLVIARY
jgi:hypothetical protein